MFQRKTVCVRIPATPFSGYGPLSAYVDSIFLIYKVGPTVVPILYDCVGIKCVAGTVSIQ